MDKVKFIVVIGVLSLLVGFAVSPSTADVRDLGDVCILFEFDGIFAPPVTHIYGALVYGARQHILLTAPGEHGSAVRTGDKILVTLNNSFVFSADESIAVSSTIHMTLDASTLRGRFTLMTTSPPQDPQSGNLSGTAVVVRCS